MKLNARKPAHTLTLPAAIRTSCEKLEIVMFTLIFNVIANLIRELTEVWFPELRRQSWMGKILAAIAQRAAPQISAKSDVR